MLRWQGRQSSSEGGSCTRWKKKCLVPQGRCKVTGATWPGCEQTVVTTGSAAEIRTEYLTLFVTGRTHSSFGWLNRTASMSGRNTAETQHRKTTCSHLIKRAAACKDRVENSAPFWHLQRKIWVKDPTSEQHDIEQLKANILTSCVHSPLNGKNGEKKQQTPTSLWAVPQPLCLTAPTSVTTTPESGRF